jgi:hypothetical protein
LAVENILGDLAALSRRIARRRDRARRICAGAAKAQPSRASLCP